MTSDFQLKPGPFVYMRAWVLLKSCVLVSLWYRSSEGKKKWISRFRTRFPPMDADWEGQGCLIVTPTEPPLTLCGGAFVTAGWWWKSWPSERIPLTLPTEQGQGCLIIWWRWRCPPPRWSPLTCRRNMLSTARQRVGVLALHSALLETLRRGRVWGSPFTAW